MRLHKELVRRIPRSSVRTALALAVLSATAALGCVTSITPIHPTTNIDVGDAVDGVRFERRSISFREPGAPISTGNIWRDEVAQYTADQLNTLINADPAAPAADTTITLELNTGGVFTVGSSKELSVTIASSLPDGKRVVSEAYSGMVDSNLEYGANQCLAFAGPILEIGSLVVAILFIANSALSTPILPVLGLLTFGQPSGFALCGCLLFSAGTGLLLQGAQIGVSNLVVLFQERRASDILLGALERHADDVRLALRGEAPPRSIPAARPQDPPPPAPAAKPTAPAQPAPPARPAPVEDAAPADAAPDARPPDSSDAPLPAPPALVPDTAPPTLHDPDEDPKAYLY